jgi:acyl-CoA synthetase (AMP-forming)/AMP-acid ligase II
MAAAPRLPAEVSERTVSALLAARAAAAPERIALIAPSGEAGAVRHVSYAALRSEALALAAGLQARGVGRGDRVAQLLTNAAAAEAHVTYHAAHLLGAVNVPLNTRYVARELRYALEFVAPAVIVYEPAFAGLVAELRDAAPDAVLVCVGGDGAASFAAVASGGGPGPTIAAVGEDDDADWIFTSGTTGRPKAVALTHGGSVACGIQAMPLWGLDAGSVYQSFAPFFTSTGCHTNLLACLAAGCTYVVEPEFHVTGTLERMQEHRTTSVFLINSVLNLIFERLGPDALLAYDLGALRRICWGAQPGSRAFSQRVWSELGERLGVELVNVYGLTEGGTCGLMLTPEDHPAALARMGDHGLSIGRTSFHPWVEHAVLGDDGQPAGTGAVGELCLRAPSLMSRYVRDPDATARALRGGWLHTGDMATVDADGFVAFVDRDKQLIRRGGLNISSAEVEGVLAEHPGVLEAAAIGVPNPVLGQDVGAVVVAADGVPPPGAEDLIAFCAERLADYKVPRTVRFVDALPRNAMGRVVKGALTGDPDAVVAGDG